LKTAEHPFQFVTSTYLTRIGNQCAKTLRKNIDLEQFRAGAKTRGKRTRALRVHFLITSNVRRCLTLFLHSLGPT
jgi:hypothetical protein